MPGFIVPLNATVQCSHQGTAQPASIEPRVLINGSPVVTVPGTYTISACALSASSGPFCATGQWINGATRVLAGGKPVAITSGSSSCVATGNPLVVLTCQPKVTAS